jgi:hypothetical protein
MFIVTLFSLKFNIPVFFYFDKIFVFNVSPGSGSGWIRIHFENWIRIRIQLKSWIRIRRKSMRIRNTGLVYSKDVASGNVLHKEKLVYGNFPCSDFFAEPFLFDPEMNLILRTQKVVSSSRSCLIKDRCAPSNFTRRVR